MNANPLKNDAIKLRRSGYSYNMITAKIGVPKSTLNNWLSGIPFEPNQELIDRVGAGKLKSALFKNRQKIESLAQAERFAQEDIGKLSQRDLLFLGIGIYLGEGEKSYENVGISNSDPGIIRTSMRWFHEICHVPLENFRLTIHCYPDNNIEETIQFWSKQTGLQISQFGKVVIDHRTNKVAIKRKKLPHGTLRLYARSNGDPGLGVTLHRRIMAWIKNCIEQM